MYKIAVVGDYDSIYGFAALGLSVFPADDRETLCAVLRRLAESGYGGKHRSGDRPGEEIRGAGSRLRYYIYRLKRTGGDG